VVYRSVCAVEEAAGSGAQSEREKRQVDKLQRLAMATGGQVMEMKH